MSFLTIAVLFCCALGWLFREKKKPLVDVAPESIGAGAGAAHTFEIEDPDITSWLLNVPLLRHLSDLDRLQLADSMMLIDVAPGKSIVAQNESGTCMFFLATGTAVARRGGVQINSYTAGDHFGELSLLTNEPRAATIIAGEEGCRVLRLEKADFDKYAHRNAAVIQERRNYYAAADGTCRYCTRPSV
eukprot:COSAG05_NODE_57_length_23291_cov_75.862668_6_plen_188_part_00